MVEVCYDEVVMLLAKTADGTVFELACFESGKSFEAGDSSQSEDCENENPEEDKKTCFLHSESVVDSEFANSEIPDQCVPGGYHESDEQNRTGWTDQIVNLSGTEMDL